MNEQRIKELADQAWVYQMTVYEYDGVRTYGEREQVFSKEKFAELIVAECMTMCDDLKTQYFKSRRFTTDFDEKNIYAEGEDIIKYKLKKQFGVQE
jgi:hypothetical protein